MTTRIFKNLYIRIFLLTISTVALTSCQMDNEPIQLVEQGITTLDLSKFDLSDGTAVTGGKIWKDTYTKNKTLEIGIFKFNHTAVQSWNYWSGFTVSNSNDNTNHLNSQGGWVKNQWGTMPKGGVNGEGTPFLISYADHKPAQGVLKAGEVIDLSKFSSSVEIAGNSKTYTAKSVSLAISPWSYYGILNGDSFARKFEKGDYFAIHIYGLDKDKKLTNNAEPIIHYFVDFRNKVNSIDTTWKKVDLSPLGQVKYLLFFLETTDVGQYGANTALYFSMDKLSVKE